MDTDNVKIFVAFDCVIFGNPTKYVSSIFVLWKEIIATKNGMSTVDILISQNQHSLINNFE